jgi:hypothetical protein
LGGKERGNLCTSLEPKRIEPISTRTIRWF